MDIKISCWIGDAPNQYSLLSKIASQYKIDSVVIENKKSESKRKWTLKELTNKIFNRILYSNIDKGWKDMLAYMSDQRIDLKTIKHIFVESINSSEAQQFMNRNNADLIIVSGTSLIKKAMLRQDAKFGILNLHTGLSPYVKGGPNCTNWCLVNDQPELIGNTIMWIDEGIDTGNIVTTEQTRLEGIENFSDLHIRVMEHAHNLYLRAIKAVIEGRANNVKQSEIAKGKTYYNKQWNNAVKSKLSRKINNSNIKKSLSTDNNTSITTVSLK